jgi:hypothetical protein
MDAGRYLAFFNKDSVTHTVVFANGLCSLSVASGETVGPDYSVNGSQHPDCNSNFPFYVGSYAYTVDGRFPGRVDTMPAFRSVTLTARTHKVRRGERLTLHGVVLWDNTATGEVTTKAPFPVLVLARQKGRQPFKPIATVALRRAAHGRVWRLHGYVWRLHVRPGVQTTYIAELKGQLPGGRIWRHARSHLFTVPTGRTRRDSADSRARSGRTERIEPHSRGRSRRAS